MDLTNTITSILLRWYDENKRDLPWREHKNPYNIWLSEIIFQQTRIEQGLPYYLKFVEAFPTVFPLASASEDEVLKLWQGLGYYSRARNLHKTAAIIVRNYDGNFPANYQELLKLPGIGKYTAAAIGSISFNLPNAVVDGNVIRLLSRLFAIEEDVFSSKGMKIIQNIAEELLYKKDSGRFNQAMMEMGSLVCLPQNPDCNSCALQLHCLANNLNKVDLIPQKKKTIEKKNRFFVFSIPVFDFAGKSSTLITRRTKKDVWQNLFQFPLLELDANPENELFDFHPELKEYFEIESVAKSKHYTHILSHQRIEADFIVFKCKYKMENEIPSGYKIVGLDEIWDYAMPRLMDKFLMDLKKI